MSSIDIFTMALRNLYKRKTRTLLTILGVVIGTASIVVMVSLGLAMNKTFDEQLEQLGDITIVTVYNPENMWYGPNDQKKKDLVLDNNAITLFKSLPGVIAATPLIQTDFSMSIGKYASSYTTVIGIAPEAMEALGYVAVEGRLLEANDRQNVVFGASVTERFRNPKSNSWSDEPPDIDPMTSTIKFSMDYMYYYLLAGYTEWFDENTPLPKVSSIRCLGVLAPKGYQADYSIYMAFDQVKKLKEDREKEEQARNASYGYQSGSQQTKKLGYDTALVKCGDLSSVKKVKKMIDDLGYPCEIPSQSLDSMERIATSMQSLLASIGAVSLIVAALGITNTMITAIYERTREIGIMKVIGASLKDIRKLFLVEAAILGSVGGTVGIGLSLGISYILNTSGFQFFGSISEFSMQTTVSLITPELCGLAVLFATVMGVASGIMPAQRAMNLSALSAIKTE